MGKRSIPCSIQRFHCLFLCFYTSAALIEAWTGKSLPGYGRSGGKETRIKSMLFQSSSSSSPAESGNTAVTNRKPSIGSIVTVECRLIPEGDFVPEPLIDGVVYHDDDPASTLTFWLGKGNYLPGLHECILAMDTVGETTETSLDAGWGSRNPNLVATVSFEDSGMDKAQIKPGVKLFLANGMQCVVTEVADQTFTIDANPPLAGASYKASINLVNVEAGPSITEYSDSKPTNHRYDVATFALGCFWGGELAFMREPGVVGTAVGYTQGMKEDPSYKEVCSGTTGHTEAILVLFDPQKVTYERLVHLAMDRLGENKYLLNQVGNDRGTQYRHGVYFHDSEQKIVAEKVVGAYGEDCVTEVLPAKKFWFAEDYHQQYLLKGGQSARKSDKSVIRCYG